MYTLLVTAVGIRNLDSTEKFPVCADLMAAISWKFEIIKNRAYKDFFLNSKKDMPKRGSIFAIMKSMI